MTEPLSHDALHLAIHLGAFLLVELGARLEQQLVEPIVLEMRIVPVRTCRIAQREDDVGRRPLAPAGEAEGLLQPDIRPVAVIGLAYDIDIDARLPRRLAKSSAMSTPPVMTVSAAERSILRFSMPGLLEWNLALSGS